MVEYLIVGFWTGKIRIQHVPLCISIAIHTHVIYCTLFSTCLKAMMLDLRTNKFKSPLKLLFNKLEVKPFTNNLVMIT